MGKAGRFQAAVPQGGPDPAGAAAPVERFTHPSCLGLAGTGPHPPLAGVAGPGRGECLPRGHRAPAGRNQICAGVAEVAGTAAQVTGGAGSLSWMGCKATVVGAAGQQQWLVSFCGSVGPANPHTPISWPPLTTSVLARFFIC